MSGDVNAGRPAHLPKVVLTLASPSLITPGKDAAPVPYHPPTTQLPPTQEHKAAPASPSLPEKRDPSPLPPTPSLPATAPPPPPYTPPASGAPAHFHHSPHSHGPPPPQAHHFQVNTGAAYPTPVAPQHPSPHVVGGYAPGVATSYPPSCMDGHTFKEDYTTCGVMWAVFCFPLGFICCCTQKKRWYAPRPHTSPPPLSRFCHRPSSHRFLVAALRVRCTKCGFRMK